MRNRANPLLAAAVLLCLLPAAAFAQLSAYSQDFESLVQTDTAALENDGWIVFGNVFDTDGTTFLYGYGPFVAPNDGFGFSTIDLLQGGVEQGVQQLSVFSDYNNGDHALGRFIESNVFQEQTIGAANVGETWSFSFQAKRGNIDLRSTALAFIKTIDPNSGFALTNFVNADMTAIPDTWGGWTLDLTIDSGLVGQLFQFGFACTATAFESSGIFYDNVLFERTAVTSVPSTGDAFGATLEQNYPNPFNPSTKIAFALENPGHVSLSVFDLAGRKVATLENRRFGSGAHTVIWNGRTDGGAFAASGRYNYVLQTDQGRLSRSMTLLK